MPEKQCKMHAGAVFPMHSPAFSMERYGVPSFTSQNLLSKTHLRGAGMPMCSWFNYLSFVVFIVEIGRELSFLWMCSYELVMQPKWRGSRGHLEIGCVQPKLGPFSDP